MNSSIESYPYSGVFGVGFSDSVTVNWTTYGFQFTNVLSRVELTTETTVDIEGNVDSFGKQIDQTQPGSVVIDARDLNLEAAKIRVGGAVARHDAAGRGGWRLDVRPAPARAEQTLAAPPAILGAVAPPTALEMYVPRRVR